MKFSTQINQCNFNDEVPFRIWLALNLLLESMDYAIDTCSDRWEFAVELEQLKSLGLTYNDFRWLVRKGLVEHQREITLYGNNSRAFESSGDLTFTDETCFILTDLGIAVMSAVVSQDLSDTSFDSPLIKNYSVTAYGTRKQTASCLPTWDSERRELRINDLVVKKFKWPAVNQETLLIAFEEDGWSPRIDDPLPPQLDQNSKRRLSDTIKCLNRKQVNERIHFRGDGTGEGVVWELV